MTDRCDLQVTDYRVLFDDDRYPASGCSVVRSGDRRLMTVQRASDAERGISSLLTQSDDLGATWAEPRPFGPPLANPETEFQGVAPAHVLDDGTVVACGIYLPKGFDRASGGRGLYRPSDILIGHRAPDADEFRVETGSPLGTFLTEQFHRSRHLPAGRPAGVHHVGIGRARRQLAVRRAPLGRRRPARSATGRSATSPIRRSARTPEVMAGFKRADPVLRPRRHAGLGHPRARPPGRHPRHQSALQRLPVLPRGVRRPRARPGRPPEPTDLSGNRSAGGRLVAP